MDEAWKVAFWIFWFWLITACFGQDTDYLEFESNSPETIQLFDNQVITLNKTYCLEEITAKTVLDSFHGGDYSRSSYRIKIMWKSKNLMTSVKLESDSLNDSYCEAKNKHYYYRKPLNQSFHVFPDEIHQGIRFLPIKLNCKYMITPELDGICRALRLRYTTPVCIDNNTCSCRHINISAPYLEAELSKDGIDVVWSIPKDLKSNVSILVISIYTEDGININKLLKKRIGIENLDPKSSIKYKQFFKINTFETIYRIQGYFENGINCRGNSTFLLLRHPETRRLNYEKITLYTIMFIFILLFFLMCLLYSWKKELKKICTKLIFLRPCEPNDCADVLTCKDVPPRKIWIDNLIYESHCRDFEPINYKDLTVIKQIASGNFGVVSLACSQISLRGCNEFAIKQIKDKAGPEGVKDFNEEIEMFKLVGDHSNVVKMLGYCLPPDPLTIIMEYVPFNLLNYLKNLRTEFERKKSEAEGFVKYAEVMLSRTSSFIDDDYISPSEVECTPLNKNFKNRELEYILDNTELEIFGLQIAKGMAHLESKNIVHRDLAARNVLMDYGKVLKVSDFGMSKIGIYVNKKSKKFPLRWMSPEALVNRVFSNKSDVWSFGVVLWEIGTLGAFPYSNLQNEEVISLLEKGGHLDRPENVTTQLYSVMVNCWARLPDERPNFSDLVEKIESFCQKSNGYVDFENLESNYVFPPMEEEINNNTQIMK